MTTRPTTVILLGPPGSGKDTQAMVLAKEYGYFILVTGDLFRAEIANQTPVGEKMQEIMGKGELLSAKLVDKIVSQELERHKSVILANGILFDGHPRLKEEIADVERLIDRYQIRPDLAVLLDVAEENLLQRLTARGREDDQPDVARHRIDVYKKETGPVIDYYKERGKLKVVDGNPAIEQVTEQLLSLFAAFS